MINHAREMVMQLDRAITGNKEIPEDAHSAQVTCLQDLDFQETRLSDGESILLVEYTPEGEPVLLLLEGGENTVAKRKAWDKALPLRADIQAAMAARARCLTGI